jgi:hypothetical protein
MAYAAKVQAECEDEDDDEDDDFGRQLGERLVTL